MCGRLAISVAILAVLAGTTESRAGAPLLELKVGDKAYQGKSVARDQDVCWLMDRDGTLNDVELDEVTAFRKVSPAFRPYPVQDMRDQLKREFGKSFDVVATTHYLVCAAPDQARHYAEVFEDIYRGVHGYFSPRGFKIAAPEFPLVAIVFPDRKGFSDYCRKDRVPPTAGLAGYYLRTSNRTALFDPAGTHASLHRQPVDDDPLAAWDRVSRPVTSVPHWPLLIDQPISANRDWHANIQADLNDTIVHEATHQVAFNIGLHSRVGENPQWVVEGLATVFEAPGVRERSNRYQVDSRINAERYIRFGNFMKERRAEKSLEEFIASDSPFRANVLDAYSQAWALTFYLLETRPSEYAGYLKQIVKRDPLQPYKVEERVADFKAAFSEDLDKLDVDFLRYMSRLK